MTAIPQAISRPSTEFGVELPDPGTGKPVFISYEWLAGLANTESEEPKTQLSGYAEYKALLAAGWAQSAGTRVEATSKYLNEVWPVLDIDLLKLLKANGDGRARIHKMRSISRRMFGSGRRP